MTRIMHFTCMNQKVVCFEAQELAVKIITALVSLADMSSNSISISGDDHLNTSKDRVKGVEAELPLQIMEKLNN